MLHMKSCSSFAHNSHPLHDHRRASGCSSVLTNTSRQSKLSFVSIKCTHDSFCSTSSNIGHNDQDINKRHYSQQLNKNRCRCLVTITSQDGCGSYSPKPLDDSSSFQDALFRNLTALYRLTRPYTWIGSIIAITSVSILPIQSLADLTPTFFIGLVKALVPSVLMNIYVVAVNQLYDVEIDKINKPDLPLASGDFSMGTGIAIVLLSSCTSLGMGVISGSPWLLMALVIWFLLGSAYSIKLPFLRWKGHPFLAPFSMMILMGLVYQLLFFIHIQKYVLGRAFVITRPLVFATAFMCILSFVNGLLKDVPDVDGDKEFGIQTLSVIIGNKKVFWVCVYMMLAAYGAAVIVGASSSSLLLSKLVTVICHSALAFTLWHQAQAVDLSSKASTFFFYMFIWKLHYVEYILIHFLR